MRDNSSPKVVYSPFPRIPHRPWATVLPRITPDSSRLLIFCSIGLLGGIFGGLLGIGGGSVIAPLLLLVTRLRPAQVAGTTLATVLVISMVGSGAYASLGNLNLELAWPIAAGSVAGSVLGSLMAKRVSMGLMLLMFLTIIPYFALKEFWPSMASPALGANLLSLGALGFGTGILSGMLGISGASLVVPSLVGFFFLDHHAAQGIAMGVALADSLAGAVTHAKARNVQWSLLAYLVVPAALAAVGGALLSDALPGSVLRYLFGVFLVIIWALMLLRSMKHIRARDKVHPVSRPPREPARGVTKDE